MMSTGHRLIKMGQPVHFEFPILMNYHTQCHDDCVAVFLQPR